MASSSNNSASASEGKGAAEEPEPEPDGASSTRAASYDPTLYQRPHPDDRGGGKKGGKSNAATKASETTKDKPAADEGEEGKGRLPRHSRRRAQCWERARDPREWAVAARSTSRRRPSPGPSSSSRRRRPRWRPRAEPAATHPTEGTHS